MPRAVSTPIFTKALRGLTKKGKKGKDAQLKALAAKGEADEAGEIKIVKRTNHGESRLPNIEKFDLGDGYRLVVQVVDPKLQLRAFLYVGDHEDADRWLDNHRNYKWVRRESDNTLDFVKCSDPGEPINIDVAPDLDGPDSLLELPLLRDITEQQWEPTGFSAELIAYLKDITAERWESDPNGILEHVEAVVDFEAAVFASDVFDHAHKSEWNQLRTRFELVSGTTAVASDEDAAAAMVDPVNSETFVTWDDVSSLPEGSDWADWMLFLHPEQKKYATESFSGPTRLRGVSGSGKTCVMVHRARQLAKKYRQDVLLVTLTESTKKLLDVLVKLLCGAEAAHIRTTTMNAIATDAIAALSKDGLRSFTLARRDRVDQWKRDTLSVIRRHSAFQSTVLAKLDERQLKDFVEDEIAFVRMRFLPNEYEKYLNAKRHGRGLPLPEKARAVILAGVQAYEECLASSHQKDHDAIVQTALALLEGSASAARQTFRHRCVLVDEVQDLSQLELRILSRIPDGEGTPVVNLPDGLFLVGDGAQTIYKKGFALKSCGITVANRSFVLQKNYRNTTEILEAAYGLIQEYEFADVDEENIQVPTRPHLSSRHGERPFIVKCANHRAENEFVTKTIADLIEEQRSRDEADELDAATEIPICVIGFTPADRNRVDGALKQAGIRTTQLKEDVTWDNNAVKISNLEQAKGHEFHAVFVVGVCQGTVPGYWVEESEWKREAARLYVGMTRARDRLFLSYDIGGRNGPSVFLSAIQANCQECEFKNGSLTVHQ